jgi:hypothetical protein
MEPSGACAITVQHPRGVLAHDNYIALGASAEKLRVTEVSSGSINGLRHVTGAMTLASIDQYQRSAPGLWWQHSPLWSITGSW